MTTHPIDQPWLSEFGIAVTPNKSNTHILDRDLFTIALRHNPRRAQLLVSKVLAKHIATPGTRVLTSGTRLAQLIDRSIQTAALPSYSSADVSPPVTIIGMAETATGLGATVASQLPGANLLMTTRDLSDRPRIAMTFEEPHSHATTHYVLEGADRLLQAPGTVVIVDDEVSHGATMANLITELKARHPHNTYIGASLINAQVQTYSAGDSIQVPTRGIEPPVTSLQLIGMQVAADAPAVVAERMDEFASPAIARDLKGRWTDLGVAGPSLVDPRHGVHQWSTSHVQPLVNFVSTIAAGNTWGKTLVIGTEEFMYPAIVVAAALEADVQSSTRSPVVIWDRPDYPFRAGFTFPSLYDSALPAYLYRQPPHDAAPAYQDVVVLVPSHAEGAQDPSGLMAAASQFGRRAWLLRVESRPEETESSQ